MALTGRQKDCLINNSTFRKEFATVLFPIAAGMLAQAKATLARAAANDPTLTPMDVEVANAQMAIANQVMREQGISLEQASSPYPAVGPVSTTPSGNSRSMDTVVIQTISLAEWTMTPDQWAQNEATAFQMMQLCIVKLFTSMLAVPTPPAA